MQLAGDEPLFIVLNASSGRNDAAQTATAIGEELKRAGRRFIESLTLFSHLANVGDVRSLVIHPASTTHFRMDAAALAAAGIGEGTIRLSIGLEDPDDLIDDLKRALKAAGKTGATPEGGGSAPKKESA